MGFLKPVRWLGRLLKSHRGKSGPATSSTVQTTSTAALLPAAHPGVRRLLSHASLRDASTVVRKTTSFSVQQQPAIKQSHRRHNSVDLQQFTHSDAAGKAPYSEDVAARNSAPRCERGNREPSSLWTPERSYETYATYNPRHLRQRIVAKAQERQRAPILWPLRNRKEPRDADARPWKAKSDVKSVLSETPTKNPSRYNDEVSSVEEPPIVHASITSPPSRLRSLSRKQSVQNLRQAHELRHKRSQTFPGADTSWQALRPKITRASLDKPLPPLPHIVEDTTVQTRWSPAVTHHTIQRDMHELHQTQITTDYHQDEYQHRVLPVIEHKILPARHFVQLDGGVLEEIPENEVLGALPADLQRRISKAAATMFSEYTEPMTSFPAQNDPAPSTFSLDGAHEPVRSSERDSITSEGHARRDTTWTYPPTFLPVQSGSEHSHQLMLHFGSAGAVGSTHVRSFSDGPLPVQLDGAGSAVGRAHVRSFSDGPPPIPPRGVRQMDTAA